MIGGEDKFLVCERCIVATNGEDGHGMCYLPNTPGETEVSASIWRPAATGKDRHMSMFERQERVLVMQNRLVS